MMCDEYADLPLSGLYSRLHVHSKVELTFNGSSVIRQPICISADDRTFAIALNPDTEHTYSWYPVNTLPRSHTHCMIVHDRDLDRLVNRYEFEINKWNSSKAWTFAPESTLFVTASDNGHLASSSMYKFKFDEQGRIKYKECDRYYTPWAYTQHKIIYDKLDSQRLIYITDNGQEMGYVLADGTHYQQNWQVPGSKVTHSIVLGLAQNSHGELYVSRNGYTQGFLMYDPRMKHIQTLDMSKLQERYNPRGDASSVMCETIDNHDNVVMRFPGKSGIVRSNPLLSDYGEMVPIPTVSTHEGSLRIAGIHSNGDYNYMIRTHRTTTIVRQPIDNKTPFY